MNFQSIGVQLIGLDQGYCLAKYSPAKNTAMVNTIKEDDFPEFIFDFKQ